MNEKLIRNKIPEIAERNGDKIVVRKARASEMPVLTRLKLMEEFHEVMDAPSHELLGELADLIEAAYAMALAQGHSAAAVDTSRAAKTYARGDFSERLVMRLGDAEQV